MSRSLFAYGSRRPAQEGSRRQMRELAQARSRRCGYREPSCSIVFSRLPNDRLPFGRRRFAYIAQIDLVMLPGKLQSLDVDKGTELFDRRPLFRKGADMQNLRGLPSVKAANSTFPLSSS